MKRRSMTLKEQNKLKKSMWILMLVVPELLLFFWIAYYFDELPLIMRVAAVAIPTLATFIFTQHHFKKIKDLSSNEVEEYKDLVTKKVYFKKMHHDGKSTRTSETRYIIVENKKFHLTRKQMSNCEEGKVVRVVFAPESEMILSASSIN